MDEGIEVIQATGRRKRAVARVKLMLGQGVITVNGKPVDDYFPRPQLLKIVRQPLEATQTGSRFDVSVKARLSSCRRSQPRPRLSSSSAAPKAPPR